eukprot:CAMPEP_0117681778 /NCGR_PEP_ID=MMETSP0804-20121206/19199_1 /TAXON_ID=1074897 /ORGANISM="Tetraselmis astigmatica, Strain CCMP880" /LENGTH=192 /DNA_ID=CAMNT_0005491629 /DNA_START=103 /DNA_END=682 /DNA_ORIENTATION=-
MVAIALLPLELGRAREPEAAHPMAGRPAAAAAAGKLWQDCLRQTELLYLSCLLIVGTAAMSDCSHRKQTSSSCDVLTFAREGSLLPSKYAAEKTSAAALLLLVCIHPSFESSTFFHAAARLTGSSMSFLSFALLARALSSDLPFRLASSTSCCRWNSASLSASELFPKFSNQPAVTLSPRPSLGGAEVLVGA